MVLPLLTIGAADCYSTGDGSVPPLDQLYYPVGIQVSAAGTALYVVNSDFDLQYNGGTVQSYDLRAIRSDTVRLIDNKNVESIPFADGRKVQSTACLSEPQDPSVSQSRDPSVSLGETCAPPVNSGAYVRDSVVIGAFATDLLLSPPPAAIESTSGEPVGVRSFDRLYAAVRGNASVTWLSVERDAPDSVAVKDGPYGPFTLQCGRDSSGRCDGVHQAGSNPDELGNQRHLTMPGEPFGMAMSKDGRSIVITHQNETKTSLFDTGLTRSDGCPPNEPCRAIGPTDPLTTPPSLKFVLDGMPVGGVGVVAIPHHPDAFRGSKAPAPRGASFLETSRALPQISLIRQYSDEFAGAFGSNPATGGRPFLNREATYPVAIGPGGTDSRGIVIDPTPRLACTAKAKQKVGPTSSPTEADLRACARKPARVFVANRSPASLLIGDLGGGSADDPDYDPDRLVLHTTIPLSAGPSKLYLAPVVESDGAYSLRVFVVCFDSATVFVYNPETEQLENVIRVGLGPFAMAFDPFSFEDVALHKQVEVAQVDRGGADVRRFRFAYLASFTNSFIQILDLDNFGHSRTFERVVYTLGRPTTPKGS